METPETKTAPKRAKRKVYSYDDLVAITKTGVKKMSDEKRRELLKIFVRRHYKSFIPFCAEIGYSRAQVSRMNTGEQRVPHLLVWGIVQALRDRELVGLRKQLEVIKIALAKL